MSSIEEKLSTISEIIATLHEFKRNLKDDQNSLSSQLSESKNHWDDSQFERFKGNAYVGNFLESLNGINSQIDKSISFLEYKYSTLETHRN